MATIEEILGKKIEKIISITQDDNGDIKIIVETEEE